MLTSLPQNTHTQKKFQKINNLTYCELQALSFVKNLMMMPGTNFYNKLKIKRKLSINKPTQLRKLFMKFVYTKKHKPGASLKITTKAEKILGTS